MPCTISLYSQLTREVTVISRLVRRVVKDITGPAGVPCQSIKGLSCFQSKTHTQYHQRSLHLDSGPRPVPGAIVIVCTYDGPSLCTC